MVDRAELRNLAEACLAHLDNGPLWVEWEENGPGPVEFLGLLDEIDRLHMIFRDNVIVPEDEYRLITQATKNTSILLDLKASQVAAVKRSVAAETERDQLHAVAVRLKGVLEDVAHEAPTDPALWMKYTQDMARNVLADPEVEKL